MEGRLPISVKVSTYEKLDSLRRADTITLFTFDEMINLLIDRSQKEDEHNA